MSPQARPQPDLAAEAGEAGVVPRDDLELPRPWRLIRGLDRRPGSGDGHRDSGGS